MEKGDECQVTGVDHKAREVLLEDGKGGHAAAWRVGGGDSPTVEDLEYVSRDFHPLPFLQLAWCSI